MAESKKEPKVVEGNLSGTHEFRGDVVVKGNIADGANVRVRDGGLRVEGDVGNNVSIDQRDGAKFSFSSSKDGVCFTSVSGGGTFIGSVHGNMTISGNKIIVDGVDVTQTLKDKQGELGLSGVEIQGKSGNDVQVRSTEGISANGFGDRADLDAQGSIRSGEVGEQSRLGADGSIRSKDVGKGSQLSAGGSIAASNVRESSNLRAGGSASVARAESGTVLSAGGSVSAGELGSNAQAHAGGSVTAGIIRTGATAEARGSLTAAMVEEGAYTSARGSKNIGSVVPPAGPGGQTQAPAQSAPSRESPKPAPPRPAPEPSKFSDAPETAPSENPPPPQPPVGEPSAAFKPPSTEPDAGRAPPSAGNEERQKPPVDSTELFSSQEQAPALAREPSRPGTPPSAEFRYGAARDDEQRRPSQPIGNPQSPFSPSAAPQAPAGYGTRPSPQARFSHAPEPPRQSASAEIDFAGSPSFLAGMLNALLSALGIEATEPRAQERGPVVTGNWPPPPGTPSHSAPAPSHAAPPPSPSQPGRTAAQPSQAPAANAGASNAISSLSKSTIAEIMEAGMTLAGAKTTPQRNTLESQQAFDAMPRAARDAEITQAHEIAKTLNPAVDQKAGRGR